MTDLEIKKYLEENSWSIKAKDGIVNIFNSSPQIINKKYDFENHIMTITTPDNTFSFNWILGSL